MALEHDNKFALIWLDASRHSDTLNILIECINESAETIDNILTDEICTLMRGTNRDTLYGMCKLLCEFVNKYNMTDLNDDGEPYGRRYFPYEVRHALLETMLADKFKC